MADGTRRAGKHNQPPEKMPGKAPEDMLDRVPERVPEDIPDRIGCQQICQIGCQKDYLIKLNVMVGITRSNFLNMSFLSTMTMATEPRCQNSLLAHSSRKLQATTAFQVV